MALHVHWVDAVLINIAYLIRLASGADRLKAMWAVGWLWDLNERLICKRRFHCGILRNYPRVRTHLLRQVISAVQMYIDCVHIVLLLKLDGRASATIYTRAAELRIFITITFEDFFTCNASDCSLSYNWKIGACRINRNSRWFTLGWRSSSISGSVVSLLWLVIWAGLGGCFNLVSPLP
jgi:hypothetical protein